jgi:hypothetical protein
LSSGVASQASWNSFSQYKIACRETGKVTKHGDFDGDSWRVVDIEVEQGLVGAAGSLVIAKVARAPLTLDEDLP